MHELHGSVKRNYCEGCQKFFNLDEFLARMDEKNIPHCDKCGSTIKPDVVLYGEALNEAVIMEAINDISHADTLIIGGTSLVVYPAAAFINYFKGKNLILINKSKTSYDSIANLTINDSIGEVFEQVMNLIENK